MIKSPNNPVDSEALFDDYEIVPALPDAEDEMSDQEHLMVTVAQDDAKTEPKRVKARPDDLDCMLSQGERLLARLDERFLLDPFRKHRAALLASVRDASWASWLESESRYTGERRVLKWWAFDGLYGDKPAVVELLEDAVDISRSIMWRTEQSPSLSNAYLLQLASKVHQRRQFRQEMDKTQFVLSAAQNRKLPPLFTDSELDQIRSAIGEYAEADFDGILGASHRHARLLSHAMKYVDAEKELQIRGQIHGQKIDVSNCTQEGVLWFRTCVGLGATIIAKSCGLPFAPALPLAYAAARTGAIWSLLNEEKQVIDPVRLCEAYCFAIEELAQIDQIMQLGWRDAQELVSASKGDTMDQIVNLLFKKGHTTIAEVSGLLNITNQAAHYHLKKLVVRRVVDRFTRGKDGGHYFLRCLVQATQ
tara:strand:- start:1765 stop:3024 length:1260 start_codon:yes stop_codon:yes gene_type:complete